MATDKNNIKKLGIIEINVLENGTGLMQDETNLTFVNCPFPKLTNSTEMFKGCSNLQTFASNLPKLSTFTDMFKDANNLTGFQCGNSTTFTSNILGVTTTGLDFINGSALNKKLITFEANMPNITNADQMFNNFTKLIDVQGDFSNVTSANSMFYNCKSLKTCPTNFSSLISAKSMFEYSGIDKIPCIFPNLTAAKQMFCECGIKGHLEVNCPIQFEKLTNDVLYMFGYLPNLTSVKFDVSSISNGSQMFGHCPSLTTCTGASFQEGGSYQSMFTESKFDQESAQLIFNQAKSANVTSLHIGVGFPLNEEHDFVKGNLLTRQTTGYDDQWWYKYCDSHTNGDCTCEENYKYILVKYNPS